MPTTISEIQDFLALHRIALVGLSRNPKDFSRMLFRDMCERGYDMVPVNPCAAELEGRRCFTRVQEITPPVEGVIVMTSRRNSARVVEDCAEAGIRRIWLHRGGGEGSASAEAVALGQEHGIQLVEGHCPFMFLPKTPFFHRIHGLVLHLTRRYPRKAQHAA
jgi:uncharacterized protein